uniref:Uncharacterized protein n=1 Tax=Ganoderma boninense TaxID=34458 RepID=A0A5K1JYS4_9APHY|nr:Uncharacterized protein [Ganoderma boninense]
MPAPPTTSPSDDDEPWKFLRFRRDRLRSEIRTRVDRSLVDLTGIQHAHMPWTEAGFRDRMIFEYHCGVEGWPRRVPFKNLSSLKGGCEPLLEIRDALVSGEMRIVKLTDEQLAAARADPDSFLPNPVLCSGPDDSVRAVTYRVIPLVLHPYDLSPISDPQPSEPPSELESEPGSEPSPSSVASPLIRVVSGREKAPRRQRKDIKKQRRRPVTNPEGRPPRRRRLGVQTAEYVYDPAPVPASAPGASKTDEDDEYEPYSMPSGSAPSDDFIECFTEPETQNEAESESEIESASESWACGGSRSEIEYFTSDEE